MTIDAEMVAAIGAVVAFVQLETLTAQEKIYRKAFENGVNDKGVSLIIEMQLRATREAMATSLKLQSQYIKALEGA